MRVRPVLTLVCLALGPWSCSRGTSPGPTAEPAADTTASAPASTAGSDSVRVVRAAAVTRVVDPSWFPHQPHVKAKVACRTCHRSVPGHETHSALACRSCHRAPTESSGRPFTRVECLSCHHSAEQRASCTTCHDPPPGPLSVERRIHTSVWPEARVRSLTFPHARHSGLECRTCHQGPPLLPVTRTCGSCHVTHHGPNADCSTCHEEPPRSVHGLSVHVSCSGSGCHAEDKVAFITSTRAACLLCHRDRVQHESGQDCAACHRVELHA